MLTSPTPASDPTLPTGPANSLIDVPGVLVGHYSHPQVYRGSTAILTPEGALAAVSVRGSNPGTLETDTLAPTAIDVYVHGISLSGGSLFGLSAARGITDWLQEHGFGLARSGIHLPIVPGAVIYDLDAADPTIVPTAEWGYWAAQAAATDPFARGNAGAGRGGTAGKGPGCVRVKGGLGTASIVLPSGIVVGAIAVVNALGSPIDSVTGRLYARDGGHDQPRVFLFPRDWTGTMPEANTTLGVVATNCKLDKVQLAKVADLAHDGFARAIRPMHTMRDGDTVFALSVGGDARVMPDLEFSFEVTDLIGAAAADVMVCAILDAVLQAEAIPGFPACREVLAQAGGDETHDA
jgi:L-aminopeptidase/D-esterase-like protein